MDNLNLEKISEEQHSQMESRVHTHQSQSYTDAGSAQNIFKQNSDVSGFAGKISQLDEDGSSPTFKIEAKNSYESFGAQQHSDNRQAITKIYDNSNKQMIAQHFDGFTLDAKPPLPQSKPSSTFKGYKLALASPREEHGTPRSAGSFQPSPSSQKGLHPQHPVNTFKQYKFGMAPSTSPKQVAEKSQRTLKHSSSFASGYQMRAIDEQSAKMSSSQFSYNHSITSLSRRPRGRAIPSQFRQDQKKKQKHNSVIDGLDLGGNQTKGVVISKAELLQSAKTLNTAKPGKKQEKGKANETFSQFTSLAEATVFSPADAQNKIGNLTKFKDGKDMLSNTLGSADLAKLLPFSGKNKEEKKESKPMTFQEKYGGLAGGKSLMPIMEDEDDDVGGGFACGFTSEQKAALADSKINMPVEIEEDEPSESEDEEPWKAVKHDAAYLRRLRLTKSADKLRPTMEKKLKDKEHFLYDPPIFDDEELEGEVPKVETSEFRPRKKSESDTSLFSVLYFSKFAQHLHLQFSNVKADFLELRSLLSDILKKDYRMNCYCGMLREVKNLIDFFLDQPIKDVLQLKTVKEIQAKMDTVVADFNQQLTEQGKLPEASPSVTKSTEAFTQAKMSAEERKVQEIRKNFLSLNEIYNVKFFFRHFKYQLSKIQQHIFLADKMSHGHRRYKATLKKTASSKKPVPSSELSAAAASAEASPADDTTGGMANFDPNMTIGQGQGSLMFGKGQNLLSQTLTLSQANRLGGGSSTPSEYQYMHRVSFNYKKLFRSRHTVISVMKPTKTPIGEPINVEKLLGEFPLEYKLSIIIHQHKLATKKWKEDFTQNREKNMQVMVCNICTRTIYTQLVQEHSKACMEKLQKIKNQKTITTDFLKIQNEGTETLLKVEKNRQERLNQASVQQTPRISQRDTKELLFPPRRSSMMNTLCQKPRTLEQGEDQNASLNCLQKIAAIRKPSINPLTDSASQLGLPSSRREHDSQSRKLSGSMNRKQTDEEKTPSRRLTEGSQVFQSLQNTSLQKTMRIGQSSKDSSKLFFDALQGSQQSETQLNPIKEVVNKKRKDSIPPVDLQRLQNSIVKQRQQEGFVGAESECMEKSPKYTVLKSQVNVALIDVSLVDFTSSKKFRQAYSYSRRFMSSRYNSARRLLVGGDLQKRRRRGSHQFNNLRLNDLDTIKCVKNLNDVKKNIIPSMKNDLFSFDQLVKQTREQGEISDIQMWQSLCLYSKEAKQFLIRHKLKNQRLFTHQRLQGSRKIIEKFRQARNRDKVAIGNSFLKRVQDNEKLEYRLIRDPSQKDSAGTTSPAPPDSVRRKPSYKNSMSHLTMKSSEIRRQSYRFKQTNLKISEKDIQMLINKEVNADMQSDFRPGYAPHSRKPSLKGSSQTVNVQQQYPPLQRGPIEEDLRSLSQMSQATRTMDRHRRKQNRLLRAEADLIGELKTIAQKSFEMSQNNHSFKRQIEIFSAYSQLLKQFKDENTPVFKELDTEVGDFYLSLQRKINTKLRELKVIHQLHLNYMKTMPKVEVDNIEQGIKVHQHDFDPYMEYTNTANDHLNFIKKAVEVVEDFDTPKPSRLFSRKNSMLPPPLTRKNSFQKCLVTGLLGNQTHNDRQRVQGGTDFKSALNNLNSPIDTSAFSMQPSGLTPSESHTRGVDELSLPSQGTQSDSKTNQISGLEQADTQPISSPSISKGSKPPTSGSNVRAKELHAGYNRFAGNPLEEESESDNNSDKQIQRTSSRLSLKNAVGGTQRSSQSRLNLHGSREKLSSSREMGLKSSEHGASKFGRIISVPSSKALEEKKQEESASRPEKAPVAVTVLDTTTPKKKVPIPQRSLQVIATNLDSPGLGPQEDKAETPQVCMAPQYAMTTQVFDDIEDFTPLSEVKANLDAMAGDSIKLKSSKDSMFLSGRSGRQNDISVDEFNIPLSDGNDSMDEESMNEHAQGPATAKKCPKSGVSGKGLVLISELQSRPSQGHLSSARQHSGQVSKKS